MPILTLMATIVNNVTDPSRLLTTSNSVNTDSRMREKLSNLFTNHMCWEFTTGLIITRFYSIVTSSHLLVNHIHFKIFYDNILQQYNSIKTTTQYITICNSNILLKRTTGGSRHGYLRSTDRHRLSLPYYARRVGFGRGVPVHDLSREGGLRGRLEVSGKSSFADLRG